MNTTSDGPRCPTPATGFAGLVKTFATSVQLRESILAFANQHVCVAHFHSLQQSSLKIFERKDNMSAPVIKILGSNDSFDLFDFPQSAKLVWDFAGKSVFEEFRELHSTGKEQQLVWGSGSHVSDTLGSWSVSTKHLRSNQVCALNFRGYPMIFIEFTAPSACIGRVYQVFAFVTFEDVGVPDLLPFASVPTIESTIRGSIRSDTSLPASLFKVCGFGRENWSNSVMINDSVISPLRVPIPMSSELTCSIIYASQNLNQAICRDLTKVRARRGASAGHNSTELQPAFKKKRVDNSQLYVS